MSVQDHWGRIAQAYDAFTTPHLLKYALDGIQLAMNRESLLDVGCGTGAFARRMSSEFGQVVAVDSSNGMIEFAKSQAEDDNVIFSVQDIQTMAGESRFQVATSFFCLMLIEEPGDALTRVFELLTSDGQLILTTWVESDASPAMQLIGRAMDAASLKLQKPSWEPNWSSPSHIRAALQAAGFSSFQCFRLSYPIECSSAREFWHQIAEGSSFLASCREQLSEKEWRLRSESAIKAIEEQLDGRICIEAPAWLINAGKTDS